MHFPFVRDSVISRYFFAQPLLAKWRRGFLEKVNFHFYRAVTSGLTRLLLLFVFLLMVAFFFTGHALSVYSLAHLGHADKGSNQSMQFSAAGDRLPTNTTLSQNVERLLHLGGRNQAIAAKGNLVYTGQGAFFSIFDLSNPATPILLGQSSPTTDIIHDITIVDHTAYVVNRSGDFYLFDILNPATPLLRSVYNTNDSFNSIDVQGTTAYIVGGTGLWVFTVADTNKPQPLSVLNYAVALNAFIEGNLCYLVTGANGLRVINVTDPADPVEIGFYDTPGWATDVVVTNQVAYIADGAEGVQIVDVSQPATPAFLARYPTAETAVTIATRRDTLYVVENNALKAVNITNPSTPQELSSYAIPAVSDIALTENTIFAAESSGGFQIINASALEELTLAGQYIAPINPSDIQVVGPYAYIADGNKLRVFDITNPVQSHQVGQYLSGTSLQGLFIAGTTGYAVGQELTILDLTDPIKPVQMGRLSWPGGQGSARDLMVDNKIAYLANCNGGMRLVNVLNRRLPEELSLYSPGLCTYAAYLSGVYAYLVAPANNGGFLNIVNVSNPNLPTSVSNEFLLSERARDVYVQGSWAYVADNGLKVVNITDPTNPQVVKRLDLPQLFPNDIIVQDHLAYFSASSSGLWIVDISTPELPQEIGYYYPTYLAGGYGRLALADNLIYLAEGWADGFGGVSVFRYTGPGATIPTPTVTPTTTASATPTAPPTVTPTVTPTSTSNRPPCPWNAQVEPVISPTDRLSQTIVINGAAGATVQVATGWGTFGAVAAAPYQVPIPLLPNTVHTLTVTVNHNRVGGSPPTLCIETRTHDRLGAPLVIVQQSATGTPTATPTLIPTTTSTPTPTAENTPTATPSPTLTATPTRPRAREGDDYETDNVCAQARTIDPDGSPYPHTFHTEADTDWVQFPVVAGAEYLIEVAIPPTSPGDVVLELYDACDQLPLAGQDYAFTPAVRLRFKARATGAFWLQLFNHERSIAGAHVRYELAVRNVSAAGQPGAAIIVAGKIRSADPVEENIYQVTNAARQLFIDYGYTDDRIYYLAPDLQTNVDALATVANLEAAITTWAADKVGADRALTLYLMDHGDRGYFFLDKQRSEWVTPEQVDQWLTVLETKAPGVKINVIIEACYAGSFIRAAQSLSKPGRVIITSTDNENLAWASRQGAQFSDHLLAALRRGESLYNSFRAAQSAARIANGGQQPWLDGDGNGQPEESSDGLIAAQRGFAFAGTLPNEQWPPYIAQVQPPSTLTNGRGQVRADVRDDLKVTDVWAIIYPPSYVAPTASEALVQESLQTIKLLDQGNGWYGATYPGFDEKGVYRVVLFAEDGQGMQARPVAITVETGRQLFLPLVTR